MRRGTKHILLPSVLALGMGLTGSLTAFAGNTYQNSYCDAFCDPLVDTGNGHVLGLSGHDGWSEADDVACALASGASPTPAPLTAASPVPRPSTQSQRFQCEWHAGQVLNYCQAYVLPQQSAGFQKTLATLDTVAAGVCWTACVSKIIPAGGVACSGTSVAASAVEFIDSLKQRSSPLAKSIQTTTAAVGLYLGADELSANLLGGEDVGGKRDSCYTAIAMTALAAMRMRDLSSSQKTQQNACTSIQQLASRAPVISPNGAASTGIATASGGSTLPPPGAMAQANGPLSNGRQPASVACAQRGLGAGGCGFSSQQLSAPDAQILNSGLGQAIAPQAAQQDPSGLFNQLSSGGNAGNIVGSALSGTAPNSDIAKAIETLASKAADDSGSLGADAPMAGGAGGGAGGAQAGSGNSFNFGMNDTAPLPGRPEEAFVPSPAGQVQPPSGDIYHSGFKGSIFDIISQRMGSLHGRVAQLQWSTPLNRALAGGGKP